MGRKDYTPHYQSLIAKTLRGDEGILEELSDLSGPELVGLLRILAIGERYGRYSADLKNLCDLLFVKFLQLKVSVKRQGRKELVRLSEKAKDKSINQFLFRRKTPVEESEEGFENY